MMLPKPLTGPDTMPEPLMSAVSPPPPPQAASSIAAQSSAGGASRGVWGNFT
jgi:hypothetical protein